MLKMLKKPLVIATATAAVGLATISTQASAGDQVLGALIGGGIGAAIGHNSGSRNGTGVGAVVGAVIGSSIAASSGYYDRGYYDRGSYEPGYGYDGYYAPRAYAAPPPVYYGVPAATVVYSSGPRYVYERPRHRHYNGHRHDHRNWR